MELLSDAPVETRPGGEALGLGEPLPVALGDVQRGDPTEQPGGRRRPARRDRVEIGPGLRVAADQRSDHRTARSEPRPRRDRDRGGRVGRLGLVVAGHQAQRRRLQDERLQVGRVPRQRLLDGRERLVVPALHHEARRLRSSPEHGSEPVNRSSGVADMIAMNPMKNAASYWPATIAPATSTTTTTTPTTRISATAG